MGRTDGTGQDETGQQDGRYGMGQDRRDGMDGRDRTWKDGMLLPRLTFHRDPFFLPFVVAPRSASSCSSFTTVH